MQSQNVNANFFLSPQIFFGELKPHAKFQNPTITSSGRKVIAAERRKKEKQAQMCAEGCEGAFLFTLCFMIFLLIRLMLGCIAKISLLTSLEVPLKCVWWVVVVVGGCGVGLEGDISDRISNWPSRTKGI